MSPASVTENRLIQSFSRSIPLFSSRRRRKGVTRCSFRIDCDCVFPRLWSPRQASAAAGTQTTCWRQTPQAFSLATPYFFFMSDPLNGGREEGERGPRLVITSWGGGTALFVMFLAWPSSIGARGGSHSSFISFILQLQNNFSYLAVYVMRVTFPVVHVLTSSGCNHSQKLRK